VTAAGAQKNRVIRRNGVQIGSRWETLLYPSILQPAVAGHPFAFRRGGGTFRHAGDGLRLALEVVQVGLMQHFRRSAPVDVRVGHAGDDNTPVQVLANCARRGQRQYLVIRARGDDAPAANGNR
jgi:hypothetical protein